MSTSKKVMKHILIGAGILSTIFIGEVGREVYNGLTIMEPLFAQKAGEGYASFLAYSKCHENMGVNESDKTTCLLNLKSEDLPLFEKSKITVKPYSYLSKAGEEEFWRNVEIGYKKDLQSFKPLRKTVEELKGSLAWSRLPSLSEAEEIIRQID